MEEVMVKAQYYQQTEIVKSTKVKTERVPPYYEIPRDSILSAENLISIILYCDYSDLCSNFSCSFRKVLAFESLDRIKKRNMNYWWMAKILRQTVECYGQCSMGDTDKDYNLINKMSGPYYCGVSVVIDMPSFNIRLSSPTSTTKQEEIAHNFCGEDGMLIQMDNPDTPQYQMLRAFNCSWLSRYKSEDER